MVKANTDGFNPSFDVRAAVSEAEGIAGHSSVLYPQALEER
jgi:hypothetical protein